MTDEAFEFCLVRGLVSKGPMFGEGGLAAERG